MHCKKKQQLFSYKISVKDLLLLNNVFPSHSSSAALPRPTTAHRRSWRSPSCPPHPQHLSPPSRRSRTKRSGQGSQCIGWWSAPKKNTSSWPKMIQWKCYLKDTYNCIKLQFLVLPCWLHLVPWLCHGRKRDSFHPLSLTPIEPCERWLK